MFAAQGFSETSVAAIAKASGITAPSLMYHFPTKEALCDAVLRDAWQRIGDELRPILASDLGLDQLVQALLAALAGIEARDGVLLSATSAVMLSGQSIGAPALHDSLLPLIDEIEVALRQAEPGRIHPDAPIRDVLVYVQLARGAQYRIAQIAGDDSDIRLEHEAFLVEALFRAAMDWQPPRRPRRSAARATRSR